MYIPDKVNTVSLDGGHPFRHLKQTSLKRNDTSQSPFRTRVEVLPDGRKVVVQIKR